MAGKSTDQNLFQRIVTHLEKVFFVIFNSEGNEILSLTIKNTFIMKNIHFLFLVLASTNNIKISYGNSNIHGTWNKIHKLNVE